MASAGFQAFALESKKTGPDFASPWERPPAALAQLEGVVQVMPVRPSRRTAGLANHRGSSSSMIRETTARLFALFRVFLVLARVRGEPVYTPRARRTAMTPVQPGTK